MLSKVIGPSVHMPPNSVEMNVDKCTVTPVTVFMNSNCPGISGNGNKYSEKFQVHAAACKNMTAFLNTAQCSLV